MHIFNYFNKRYFRDVIKVNTNFIIKISGVTQPNTALEGEFFIAIDKDDDSTHLD